MMTMRVVRARRVKVWLVKASIVSLPRGRLCSCIVHQGRCGISVWVANFFAG